MKIQFHNSQIETRDFGYYFSQPDTSEHLGELYKTIRYRDALNISLPEGEVWLFDYGVMIGWGVSENDLQKLRSVLEKHIQDNLQTQDFEQFEFIIDSSATFRVHNDKITLTSEDVLTRLAVSHALAQSAKLSSFENKAKQVIIENSYLSRTLAKTGRIPLSRRDLSKLRGQLFDTSSDISLNFNLLDVPEFFWDYPELENVYQTIAKYLDLIPRVELLNHKLSVIHELLDMLADELKHKHSAFLEWIIIVLIAIDIVIYMLPK